MLSTCSLVFDKTLFPNLSVYEITLTSDNLTGNIKNQEENHEICEK